MGWMTGDTEFTSVGRGGAREGAKCFSSSATYPDQELFGQVIIWPLTPLTGKGKKAWSYIITLRLCSYNMAPK